MDKKLTTRQIKAGERLLAKLAKGKPIKTLDLTVPERGRLIDLERAGKIRAIEVSKGVWGWELAQGKK